MAYAWAMLVGDGGDCGDAGGAAMDKHIAQKYAYRRLLLLICISQKVMAYAWHMDMHIAQQKKVMTYA